MPDLPTVIAAKNPSAWWRLNEASGTTIADSSGNSQTGTLTVGTSVTYGATGLPGDTGGSGLTFNASYITVPDSAFVSPTTGITVVVWIREYTQVATTVPLVDKYTGSGANGYTLRAHQDNTGSPTSLVLGGGTSAVYTIPPTALSTAATWKMLAFTANGTNHVLYLNGAQAATVATAALPSDGSSDLYIGDIGEGPALGSNYMFRGTLSNVQIYGTALSGADILAQYTAGTTTPDVGGGGTAAVFRGSPSRTRSRSRNRT